VARFLAVDDDADLLGLLAHHIRGAGHEVETLEDSFKARDRLREEDYDLLLTDLEMPEISGIDLLQVSREIDPSIPVVLLTGHATVETAVEAMKGGAFDYLKKPFPPPDLLVVIERGLKHGELERENRRLRRELRDKYRFENLVGNSPAMQPVFRLVERVGPTSSTVLILGESGTGKELIARALHETSPRAHRRFVSINCSSLQDTLLESELFGHERGAFTGAVSRKKGLFEVANGGTIFLDEIADTSPTLQAELLRVLQEGEMRRVGGTEDIHVDVRVLTATNRDLKERIRKGHFREDLYYRLNVVSLPLPPLRDRMEDLALLAEHFIRKKSVARDRTPKIAPEARALLQSYDWPGNIRELENAIERAIVLCDGDTIQAADLPTEVAGSPGDTRGAKRDFRHGSIQFDERGEPRSLAELEKIQIRTVLETTGGHRERASQILGITRRTLYQKIKFYGIEAPSR
jgi:DNA-binding NtrC family response regulator